MSAFLAAVATLTVLRWTLALKVLAGALADAGGHPSQPAPRGRAA